MDFPKTDIPRLIVGMSRAGTTSMTRAMNARGDTASFGETGFWGNRWLEPNVDGYSREQLDEILNRHIKIKFSPSGEGKGALEADLESIRSALRKRFAALTPPVSPLAAYAALGEAIASACGRAFWVEKTPHHLMHMDRIMQGAPDSRVLVMMRSPEEYMLSNKHHGERFDPAIQQNYKKVYHPMAVALVCRGYLKSMDVAKEKYSDAIKVVWLDQLKTGDDVLFGRIVEHFRLPSDITLDYPRDNSSFKNDENRPTLLPHEVIWLRLLAGKTTRKHGYVIQKQKGGTFAFLLSILKLPLWAVNIIRVYRKTPVPISALIKRWLK